MIRGAVCGSPARTDLWEPGAGDRLGRPGVKGAVWMRLFFDRSNLPVGSDLRLTSLRDGAVQRHDARTLIDYGQSSAYFNEHRK